MIGRGQQHRAQWGADRPALLASADHDFSRLACGSRTAEQLPAAFTFLLTWACVPSIYFGDEIGVRYQPGLPNVEGSMVHPSYNRAGARTPMHWDGGPNAGFSTAAAERLYLPVDPDPGRPTVAAQRADPGSLMHLVRRLVALRREIPALAFTAETEVLAAGYPFVYLRGGTHLVVVNPSGSASTATSARITGPGRSLVGSGVTLAPGAAHAEPFGYAVVELPRAR